MIQELRDLYELNMSSKSGIHKNWVYKDKRSLEISGDYLQKIAYSISDYNRELRINKKEAKDIVFMILLASWIKDTFDLLLKTYKNDVVKKFMKKDLSEEKEYLEAIRSFVVAHPMSTNRHSKFNMDGSYICNDVVIKDGLIFPLMHDDSVYVLNFSGLHIGKGEYDYLLKVYSDSDDMRYFKYICCSIDDITICVSKYIDELYRLAYYLGSLKKRNFLENIL